MIVQQAIGTLPGRIIEFLLYLFWHSLSPFFHVNQHMKWFSGRHIYAPLMAERISSAIAAVEPAQGSCIWPVTETDIYFGWIERANVKTPSAPLTPQG